VLWLCVVEWLCCVYISGFVGFVGSEWMAGMEEEGWMSGGGRAWVGDGKRDVVGV